MHPVVSEFQNPQKVWDSCITAILTVCTCFHCLTFYPSKPQSAFWELVPWMGGGAVGLALFSSSVILVPLRHLLNVLWCLLELVLHSVILNSVICLWVSQKKASYPWDKLKQIKKNSRSFLKVHTIGYCVFWDLIWQETHTGLHIAKNKRSDKVFFADAVLSIFPSSNHRKASKKTLDSPKQCEKHRHNAIQLFELLAMHDLTDTFRLQKTVNSYSVTSLLWYCQILPTHTLSNLSELQGLQACLL